MVSPTAAFVEKKNLFRKFRGSLPSTGPFPPARPLPKNCPIVDSRRLVERGRQGMHLGT
jgi:hypothetical protein